MKKKYTQPTKHKQSTKQKHPAETSTSTSLSASSSVDTISIEQKRFEQLKEILLTPLKDFTSLKNPTNGYGESTMGDFIVDRILLSLRANDIANGQKIKYIKIIEQFLLKSDQKIDETAERLQLCELIFHNLISTREHLKIKIEKGEESVIKYLVNSKALGENLFNPNRLDKYKLTLLDLVESLQGQLNINSDIKKNEKLIRWLKEKGAKSSLEITQNLNKADYDKNVEKFKEQLEKDSSTSEQKSEGYLCVSKKASVLAEDLRTSAELLECFDVILNYETDNISRCMRLFFSKRNSESYELHIVNALLRECYKDIDIDNYIKIISSIVKDIPSDFLKMVYYEELGEELIKRYGTNGILKSKEEKLLDEYTSKLVELTLENNSGVTNDSAKCFAYEQHLNYCKYKKDLKETITVSLALMKYADDTEIEKVLYGLLVDLYGIETGVFKNDTLNYLVEKFNLPNEARKIFIDLFSYHYFDRAFVKKIQEELEIIEQAFSEHKPEIRTTIKKFSRAFIMQTGECSVSTIQEIVDDPNFESTTSESSLRILGCLKNWSKDKIEQINYQKVIDKLLNKDNLGKDPIVNIKVAEVNLALEDLVQTKHYLDSAKKLLEVHTSHHTFFQHATISPKVYLYEVKLGLMLKAFADKNKDFLEANLGYIKETYNACNAIKGKFFSYYKNILDICQYYLLSRDNTTDSKLGEKLKNIIHNITEDDELTFTLEVINQTISEEQRIKEQHISEEQQIVIPASEHIDASSNYVSKEYISEEKSETEANNTAATQEDSLYKENFVKKCLNHWTIIHKYYQNLKKSTQSSHDKSSNAPQENYQIWHTPDNISYTTKNEDIVNIGKKHNNIYAVINPDLLGSLQESQKKAFTKALDSGIVGSSNQHGVKILGKYLPELKIDGDARLYATKIYKNNNGAVLIEFNKKGNHTDVKNAFKYKTIDVIKVSGADYHTQEEDSTLKYNVPQEGYPNIEDYHDPYDEVGCIGAES